MSRNKYIPTMRVSETIYEKSYGKDMKDSVSVVICVEYIWNRPYAVDVQYNICSEACMEQYGDCDIERCIHIREEAVQKLANKFTAKDAKTLLNHMADRFRSFENDAYKAVKDWLEQKDIKYSVSMY